jgi:hypothetical protein
MEISAVLLSTLYNIPEERRSHSFGGGSLKWRKQSYPRVHYETTWEKGCLTSRTNMCTTWSWLEHEKPRRKACRTQSHFGCFWTNIISCPCRQRTTIHQTPGP